MKDQEFIELLNLYLDHEIAVADAARLETEVQRNPARYRVYRQYCQMHKACALLAPAHAGEAPAVATFEARSWNWANPFAIGGLVAAAACVSFVLFHNTPTAAPSGTAPVAENSQPAVITNDLLKTSVSPADRNSGEDLAVSVRLADRQPTLLKQTLRWNANDATPATVQDVRFNWMESIQLSSVPQLPADSLRFETVPTPKDAQRSFGPAQQLQSPAEYNALQFQK